MTGRIVRSADFERVLRMAPRAKSPHFALHHLSGAPLRRARPQTNLAELSTDLLPTIAVPVDESAGNVPGECLWIGTVIPKRHAKRSVTRSLLKRQIHAAVGRQTSMPDGLWVVRLRAPVTTARFVSAASDLLKEAMRRELDTMFASVLRRQPSA